MELLAAIMTATDNGLSVEFSKWYTWNGEMKITILDPDRHLKCEQLLDPDTPPHVVPSILLEMVKEFKK